MNLISNCFTFPPIKELNDFPGHNEYFDFLNNLFKKEFLEDKIYFKNKIVEVSQQLSEDGKLERFWHIISKTDYAKQTKTWPDLERCNAIFYIQPLIEACQKCKNRLVFSRKEKNKYKTYIWCTDKNIMIVLEKHHNKYIFITCFIVKGKRNNEKYMQRYLEFKQKQKTATKRNRS